ncbi:hypothetical protein [Roseivirga sp.]|uniref:hypothetical protein n=1 Tax=Roseivirga sp. TaxID=1964215 RepID=UPI003B52C5B9
MQGKDQLEQFIGENREAFDTAEPGKKSWEVIEQQLHFNDAPKVNRVGWYWKAAVFLLLGAVGFLMVDRYQIQQTPELEATNVEKFKELETFYTSLIANKQERLESEMSPKEATMYLEVEMKELDEIYSDLKALFLESQPSEQVMERLVHLLRQKLKVMDSRLEKIEREKLPEEMKEVVDLSM